MKQIGFFLQEAIGVLFLAFLFFLFGAAVGCVALWLVANAVQFIAVLAGIDFPDQWITASAIGGGIVGGVYNALKTAPLLLRDGGGEKGE